MKKIRHGAFRPISGFPSGSFIIIIAFSVQFQWFSFFTDAHFGSVFLTCVCIMESQSVSTSILGMVIYKVWLEIVDGQLQSTEFQNSIHCFSFCIGWLFTVVTGAVQSKARRQMLVKGTKAKLAGFSTRKVSPISLWLFNSPYDSWGDDW